MPQSDNIVLAVAILALLAIRLDKYRLRNKIKILKWIKKNTNIDNPFVYSRQIAKGTSIKESTVEKICFKHRQIFSYQKQKGKWTLFPDDDLTNKFNWEDTRLHVWRIYHERKNYLIGIGRGVLFGVTTFILIYLFLASIEIILSKVTYFVELNLPNINLNFKLILNKAPYWIGMFYFIVLLLFYFSIFLLFLFPGIIRFLSHYDNEFGIQLKKFKNNFFLNTGMGACAASSLLFIFSSKHSFLKDEFYNHTDDKIKWLLFALENILDLFVLNITNVIGVTFTDIAEKTLEGRLAIALFSFFIIASIIPLIVYGFKTKTKDEIFFCSVEEFYWKSGAYDTAYVEHLGTIGEKDNFRFKVDDFNIVFRYKAFE